MLRLAVMVLICVSMSYSQWGLTAGVFSADQDGLPTFITIGSTYEFTSDKKMTVKGVATYGFGSEDVSTGFSTVSATYGIFEVGAQVNYALADAIDGVATASFASYSVTVSGFTLTSPSSEFTVAAGGAFNLSDAISLQATYAFVGAKGIRAGLGFNF